MNAITIYMKRHGLFFPRCGAACVEMIQELARGPIRPVRTKHSVLAVPNNTGGGMGQLIVHQLAVWDAEAHVWKITEKGADWLRKLREVVPAELMRGTEELRTEN